MKPLIQKVRQWENYWLTDSSRIQAGHRCRMSRYLGYSAGPHGTGLTRRSLSVPLLSGTAVHAALQLILEECMRTGSKEIPSDEYIQLAVSTQTEKYKKQVKARGLDAGGAAGNPGGDERAAQDRERVAEQTSLLAALVYGYVRITLPVLLEEFEILAVEQEQDQDLGARTLLMTRPDALLRDRTTGEAVMWDFKCGLPNQLLLRADGSTVRFDQVQEGERLVSYDIKKRQYVTDKVQEVGSGGRQEAVLIVTELGRRLYVSANHPVLVGEAWIEAAELLPGDDLQLRALATDPSTICNFQDEEESALLGYLVGDGGLSADYGVKFTNTSPGIVKEVGRLVTKFGGVLKLAGPRAKIDYRANGLSPLAKKHGLLKKVSADKFIPSMVLSGSTEMWVRFLAAYFDCDGYISKPKHPGRSSMFDVVFYTTSERLAAETQILLTRLGIRAHSWKNAKRLYRDELYDYYYTKVTSRDQARKLLKLILPHLKNELKQERATGALALYNSLQPKFHPDCRSEEHLRDRVLTVERLGAQDTIAVTMKKHGTFVTSSIVTHNTASSAPEAYVEGWKSSPQMMAGARAASYMLGEPVKRFYIDVLMKGSMKPDYNEATGAYDGPRRQQSFLVWPYFKPGSPPLVPDEWQPFWKYACAETSCFKNKSGLPHNHTLGKGWERKLHPEPWKWVQSLRKGDLATAYQILGPYSVDEYKVDQYLRGLEVDEEDWIRRIDRANKTEEMHTSTAQAGWETQQFQEELDRLFPRSYACENVYGAPCPYKALCFKEQGWQDPIGSGLYIPRAPHHEQETAAFKALGIPLTDELGEEIE